MEVAPTVTSTYGTGGNNVPLVGDPVAQETICIAGNTIDREPENGGNGLGCQADISYTITTSDRHAVFSRQRSDKFSENHVIATQSARPVSYTHLKLIYVASPYAGDVERNTEFAKKACRHVMNEGHAFFAPHLLYPAILDEHQPKQRQLGLDMGLAMLSRCDELWCYGDHISPGMYLEIEEASRLGIPIRRVMEQEIGFAVGKVKNSAPVKAPAQTMEMV